MPSAQATRKLLGAWYTPPALIDGILDGIFGEVGSGDGPLRVLDPACGDGRFLGAVAERAERAGRTVELTGCDVDATALASARRRYPMQAIQADALAHDWGDERFDVVVGNPPFLSQMAATTTRRGASRHGGGPYADAAAEFLALAVRLAVPDGGRIGLVLPQSILASRDAGPVRDAVAERAELVWSWWEPDQRGLFDAAVQVCALGWRTRRDPAPHPPWTAVVTDQLGIPRLPDLTTDGCIGDRVVASADFRDEYYALVGAVTEGGDGPALVTSGLIDPGRCRWGERPIRFARRRFDQPRVDLDRLPGRFAGWADRKLVPKVLVANQTRVVEAVADPGGDWLPGVPVSTLTPADPGDVPRIAAVLTSPVASAWCWHQAAGTGLSSRAMRLSPALLAGVPWPAGDLRPAQAALAAGDVDACGAAVDRAYGVDDAHLHAWWAALLPR